MKCSIAIYPEVNWKSRLPEWEEYMRRAAKCGFREVFTTLHLPELALSSQVEMFSALVKMAKSCKMELTADIGGGEIKELLESGLAEQVRQNKPDFLRLDYGFSMEQAGRLYRQLHLRGFVINASIYSREEAEALVAGLRGIDGAMELCACHNYYPRPETGLDEEFFEEQNRIFSQLGMAVYGCIPGKSHPRGPLGFGLPTLERHRDMSLEQVSRELVSSPFLGGIMAADEFFTEEELKVIEAAVKKEPLALKIRLEPGISEKERRLILGGIHHIRYDSNRWLLRSQTSREMSRPGERIERRETMPRLPGAVTVDNEGYGRYSGEVQIVTGGCELSADSRVNCCGTIVPEDMWKLEFYRKGCDYVFVEDEAVR